MKVISVEQMRELDRLTCDKYVSGRDLMRQAGEGVFKECVSFARRYDFSKFLVICGKGNNGGDGYVVADLLSTAGYEVDIISVCEAEKLRGDAAFYAKRVSDKVKVYTGFGLPEVDFNTVIIDALLGTGFTGELKTGYVALINTINNMVNPVISVDIPSGLNGNTGVAQPVAIVADVTVTIGAPKNGLFFADALEYCGRLQLVKIGIPTEAISCQESEYDAIFEQDIRFFDARRKRDSHKKTFGTVITIGGSDLYHGAPQLASYAALRAGCGYVTLAVPECINTDKIPLSVIRKFLPVQNGVLGRNCIPMVEEFVPENTVTVFGPGCGRDKATAEVLGRVISSCNSLVLDADGLWQLTKLKGFQYFTVPAVITPHPGEMQRLLEHFLPSLTQESRIEQALGLSELINAYVVLKGRTTIIASPEYECWINTSGDEALATAGTGDVLAGIIAAFMAESLSAGRSIEEAVKAAVFVHGRASEKALCRRSFCADDIPEMLAQVFTDFNRLS